MDDITSVLSLDNFTFEEAKKYFGEKIPLTPSQFFKLQEEYRTLAFTVSGYTSIQILKKFQEALQAAIEDGTTMEAFREQMNSFLAEKGYEGITPFQTDNIFRTNIQTAYNVGHYEVMSSPGVMKLRPYWMYMAVMDEHTRPSHMAMNGKVFLADSSVWDVWYPPNGYRCRCIVVTLSERQVREMGVTVEDEMPDRAELPDGRFVVILPQPGFGVNPAKHRFTPDLEGYPETLVKAYEKMQTSGSGV